MQDANFGIDSYAGKPTILCTLSSVCNKLYHTVVLMNHYFFIASGRHLLIILPKSKVYRCILVFFH